MTGKHKVCDCGRISSVEVEQWQMEITQEKERRSDLCAEKD